jgi:multimeric flavodoxin WrbA
MKRETHSPATQSEIETDGGAMKVLAICGSPRGGKSQTRAMTEGLLSEAKAKGASIEFVDLGKARIGFCQACEVCHQGPDCVLNDDAKGILCRMLEADGIVLASPVYLDHVTAQMKALLDRSSHFIHCLRLTGKYIVAVTTSGGGGGANVASFLKGYSATVGAQYVGGVDARVPLQESDFAAARELGARLVAAIHEKRTYPEQLRAIESQKKRFGQIVAFHKDRWPYEHKYWQDKGWL